MKEITFCRKARLDMRISQEEMADRMGISRTAYVKLENGTTRILSDCVLRFSRAAGIPLLKIIGECFPDEGGRILREEADAEERLQTLRREYEERLERKASETDALKAVISAQQQTIDAQRGMLDMYARQSAKND